jgi:hypothetical protein
MMFQFPVPLFEKYETMFEIDPLSILERDVIVAIAEISPIVRNKLEGYEYFTERAWETLCFEQKTELKLLWIWNELDSYERSLLFDHLYNTN